MILVTADIHAHRYKDYATTLEDGRNSRIVEIVDTLVRMAEDGRKRNCRAFVIAGDLFHSRRSIEVAVLYEVSTALEHVAAMYEQVFIIVGNHDISISGDGGYSSRVLHEKVNVQVISEPTVKTIAGIRVGLVPWPRSRTDFQKTMKDFARWPRKITGIIGHVALDSPWGEATDYETPGDIRLNDLLIGHHKWAMLGHFHGSRTWRKRGKFVAYVGSPLQHNWGERDQEKGYWIVSRNRQPWMVTNEGSPRFVLVKTPKEAAKARQQDYVRVVGKRSAKLAKRVKAEKKVVIEPPKKEIGDVRLPPQSAGDEKIIEAFVKAKDYPEDLDPTVVKDIGLKLLRQPR